MSMDSIKRRREERLRQLREQMKQRTLQQGDEEAVYETVSWDRSSSVDYKRTREDMWEDEPWSEEESISDSLGASFLLKLLVSLFILSFTFVIYNVNLPFSNQAKSFVGQVMNREFNFQGVMVKVEQVIGERPSILPVFHDDLKRNIQPVWKETPQKEYTTPVKGDITEPFLMSGKGVQITADEQEIKAIDKGWIIYIGKKEGQGKTIIIQHDNKTKSWYSGGIEQIQVAEHDWVEPGQVIAQIEKGKSLFFSMEMSDQFVDPTSVIPFD